MKALTIIQPFAHLIAIGRKPNREPDMADALPRPAVDPRREDPGRSHEHAEGPWCWVLTDIERLTTPIPWSGAQGLWTPPADLVARAAAAPAEPSQEVA